MQLAVMVGSLRQRSFHRKLYENYRSLNKARFDLVEISIAEFPHYSEDYGWDDVPQVTICNQALKDSAGILFFSPEYNYSLPGVVKNALDWFSRLPELPLNDKKAAIIGGSPGNIGSARMQYELRKIGVFLNLHFLNKPEVMVGRLHEKFDTQGQLSDESTIEFLKGHAEAFQAFIEC